MSTIWWEIDTADQLCAFSDLWLTSAPDRDRERLAPARLLGRSLLSLISDARLRGAYAGLLQHIRQHQHRIRFAYRCDTAAERRFYLLQLAPRPQGGIRFATRLLQRQQRSQQPGWQETGPARIAAWDFCSQCNRVAMPPVGWFELDEISTLALFTARGAPRLWPTLCPPCLDALQAAMTP